MSEQRMFDVFAEAQHRTPMLERLVLLKLTEWQREVARIRATPELELLTPIPERFPGKPERKKPWHRSR